jgi:hypothetical protein
MGIEVEEQRGWIDPGEVEPSDEGQPPATTTSS